MPYIKQEDRNKFESLIREMKMSRSIPLNGGELNFIITNLIKVCWENSTMNYDAISEILSSLEGAKLEFYRRTVAQYEDRKLKENGDVYND